MSANEDYYKWTVQHCSDVSDPASGIANRPSQWWFRGNIHGNRIAHKEKDGQTLPVAMFEPILPSSHKWMPTELRQPQDPLVPYDNVIYPQSGFCGGPRMPKGCRTEYS